MDRRSAIKFGFTSAGILILPTKSFTILYEEPFLEGKETVFWVPLLTLLGRFAFAVGTSVVASTIADHISKHKGSNIAKNMHEENKNMINAGYSDFSRPSVYQNNSVCIYPATKYEQYLPDKTNVRSPIFDVDRSHKITHFQGPDFIGMGMVAGETADARGQSVATDYFQPKKGIQICGGSFEQGYHQSTQYYSQNGTSVEVDYKKTGSNQGLVKVIASKGFNRLVDKEYDVMYT